MKDPISKLHDSSLDKICFPVELRNNPRHTNREYSRVVTGIIDGAEWDLNYCSPTYELIQNAELFPKIEELLNAHNIKFSAKYTHIQHVRFYADYVIEDPRFAIALLGTNDVLKWKWHQEKSYNGKTKLAGWGGMYRLVCKNGLMLPCTELKQFNLSIVGKHTEAILVQLALFENMLKSLIDNIEVIRKTIGDRYALLGGRMVADPKARVEEVLKAVGMTAVDNSKFNSVNDIVARIVRELEKPEMRGYNGKVNDWLVYNGINQYIHDTERNSDLPEVRSTKDSNVLEYMLVNA